MNGKKFMMRNPVLEAIGNRRSVRAYEKDPVSKEVIESIIEAGNQAPCTYPFQSWRFVVVQDKEFREKLFQTVYPIWKESFDGMRGSSDFSGYHEKAMRLLDKMEEPKDLIYYSAPVILFVIGPETNPVDCGLACENIMIAATSFGLGSCYVGFGSLITGNEEVVEELELAEGERIYGPIVLGYPKDLPEERALRMEKKGPTVKWV